MYYCDMKTLFLFIVAFVALGYISCVKAIGNESNVEYSEYELYLDSVWNNNPEYYLDVVVETDEYQEYIANQNK